MVETFVLAWCALCCLFFIRTLLVGNIQMHAIDLTRDIVDHGILNGAIDSVTDIELLYDNLEKRSFFLNVADLTRWTLRGFYPELARWEAAHK